jgi:hypothetical protein
MRAVAFVFECPHPTPHFSEYFLAEMSVTVADTTPRCHLIDLSRIRFRRAPSAQKARLHPSLSTKRVLTSAHVFMRFAPLKLISSVRRPVRTQNRGSMQAEHGRRLDIKLCMGGHDENL